MMFSSDLVRQSVGPYLRVSTDEQKRNETIKNQQEFLTRYCDLHGINAVDWYLDDGESGTIPIGLRTAGSRLVEDARTGRISTVLILKLDRLGRDPRQILNAIYDLEALGLRVVSATEPFDTQTPTGRFLLTILAGVAGLERDTIIERSKMGTDRCAREGIWLGGIVPYGYRVTGRKKDARLEISEAPLPGLDMSEADVIRLIYRLTTEEHWSCIELAGHLNALGVPPSYAKDGRELLRGKRKQATQAIWRPGRIRNMIVNTVYKGIHTYGKRSTTKDREVIEREVPAIVDEVTWARAQEVLREHFLFNKRNSVRHYLLRGLIRCGICGLTYTGTAYKDYPVGLKAYYVCSGKHSYRCIYGLTGKPCPSKAIRAEALEDRVWNEIVGFVREPGPVLAKVAEERRGGLQRGDALAAEASDLERVIKGKIGERNLILDLYRRGRIVGADLDRQLDKIAAEERDLRARLSSLNAQLNQVQSVERELSSAEELLRQLRERLSDEPTWDEKRALIESLVSSIRVDTVDADTKRKAIVTVTYRFT